MGYRDFTTPFTSITGKPIYETDERNQVVNDAGGKPIPVTLATLLINMLCARDHDKEPHLTNAQSRERIRLADRIADNGLVEVDSADIALLTATIERYAPSPLVADRCLAALDKEIPKAAAKKAS